MVLYIHYPLCEHTTLRFHMYPQPTIHTVGFKHRVIADLPNHSETLKLCSNARRMAGWDEVFQCKHLSPPIPQLSFTQVN